MKGTFGLFKAKYLYMVLFIYFVIDFFLDGPLKQNGVFSYIYLYLGRFSYLLYFLLFVNLVLNFVQDHAKKDEFFLSVEFFILGAIAFYLICLMIKMKMPFDSSMATSDNIKEAMTLSVFKKKIGLLPSFAFYLLLSRFNNFSVYTILLLVSSLSLIVVCLYPLVMSLINAYSRYKMSLSEDEEEEELDVLADVESLEDVKKEIENNKIKQEKSKPTGNDFIKRINKQFEKHTQTNNIMKSNENMINKIDKDKDKDVSEYNSIFSDFEKKKPSQKEQSKENKEIKETKKTKEIKEIKGKKESEISGADVLKVIISKNSKNSLDSYDYFMNNNFEKKHTDSIVDKHKTIIKKNNKKNKLSKNNSSELVDLDVDEFVKNEYLRKKRQEERDKKRRKENIQVTGLDDIIKILDQKDNNKK